MKKTTVLIEREKGDRLHGLHVLILYGLITGLHL